MKGITCGNCGDEFEFDWNDDGRDRTLCRECEDILLHECVSCGDKTEDEGVCFMCKETKL